MNLDELYEVTTRKERDQLAQTCEIAPNYLDQCRRGDRKPGTNLCRKLIAHEPRLTLPELRPDIWGIPETPEQKRIRELEEQIKALRAA